MVSVKSLTSTGIVGVFSKSAYSPVVAIVAKSAVFAFNPIAVAVVVAKLGSSPSAAASSFSVSNVSGEDPTRVDIA